MSNPSTHTVVDRHPVIYAGRFVEQVRSIDLPKDCIVLGEQNSLPCKLTEVLNRANIIVFLDLLSFPFEAMTDEGWDVPILAVLPSGFDLESLAATFGSVLFERLGFFDRLVTPDLALWNELRRKYNWAESQRIPVGSTHPYEVVKAVRILFETEFASPATLGRDHYGAPRWWGERNSVLPASGSHEASRGIDLDLRCNKALHRVQAAALKPRFAARLGRPHKRVPLDVLEVGAGVGRWASSFDPTETRFVGIDVCENLIRAARANFSEQQFDTLSSDLLFPYDDGSFDLVFGVTIMQHNPTPTKQTLLSEMWRVARTGGRLLFLEDFVFTRQPERPTVYPMTVTEFVELVLEATAGQIVLEYVESLRYPDEDLHRGGLISLLKLGAPKDQ